MNIRAKFSGFLLTLQLLTLMFLSLFSTLSVAADKNHDPNELLFGSVAMDIPVVMHQRLKPLTRYLSLRLHRPVSLKLSPNMGDAIREVADKKVQLAYLTPVAYLRAHQYGNARLIAKTITNGKASFQLMIVVKENSPYKTVADLKGKRFAFGDKRALLQRAAVVGAGIKLEDFSKYRFIGHYDNIARAVMNGDFDAGIVKDTMAFQWQGKGLRILYASPHLPPYNITANGDISDKLAAELKTAFLELNPKNPEDLKVIKAVDKDYDGFAETSDAEYDIVRKLIAPFKNANSPIE
jgi:phosphonate transport system substrate-binding protein